MLTVAAGVGAVLDIALDDADDDGGTVKGWKGGEGKEDEKSINNNNTMLVARVT